MSRESGTKYGSAAAPDSVDLAARVDAVDGGITYVGLAAPGATSSSAVWRIKRLTEVGSDLTVDFADGNDYFDNVWDDRLSLLYS